MLPNKNQFDIFLFNTQIVGESSQFDLPIQQAKKLMYSLPSYQVVATIEALIGQKVVTFTSCVMVSGLLITIVFFCF